MRVATILLPYLIGAAITLVVQVVIQLYVVPRVETRKRREDRFERNVLELGGMLTTVVQERASEARLMQGVFRAMHQGQGDSKYDQAKLVQELPGVATKAREATWAFSGLIHDRVGWLTRRIVAFMPDAREILYFQLALTRYRAQVFDVTALSSEDGTSDDAFEEAWVKETDARRYLIDQIELLANLQHPPRRPRFRRLTRGWYWLRKAASSRWRRRRCKPKASPPE